MVQNSNFFFQNPKARAPNWDTAKGRLCFKRPRAVTWGFGFV